MAYVRHQNQIPTPEPQPGDLRVWWIPQVPGKPIYFPVKSAHEGARLLQHLARYDLFQLSQHIKPDFANAGGLEVFEHDPDVNAHAWVGWYFEDAGSETEEYRYYDDPQQYAAEVDEDAFADQLYTARLLLVDDPSDLKTEVHELQVAVTTGTGEDMSILLHRKPVLDVPHG